MSKRIHRRRISVPVVPAATPPTNAPHPLRPVQPQTRAQLRHWAASALGLILPESPRCPHHDTPLDYLWHAYTGGRGTPSPDCVVWACRGGGKTQLAAAATLLEALYKPAIQIRILGGSLEQSEKMYAYLRAGVLRSFPDQLRAPPTRRSMTFRNGSRVEILAQSDRSVRGQRVQRLRCDEVELFTPPVWEAAQLTTRTVAKRSRQQSRDHQGATVDSAPNQSRDRQGATVDSALNQSRDRQGATVDSALNQSRDHKEATTDATSRDMTPESAQDACCSTAGGLLVIRAGIEALSTAHVPGGMMQQIVADAQQRGARVFRWCVWDVVEKCEDSCARCALRDSCAGRAHEGQGFLPVNDLRAMRGRVSAATWESEMLCAQPRHRDRVFEEFSRARHVRGFEVEPDGRIAGEEMLWTCGVDFGFAGAFACLFVAVGKVSGRVHVVDELIASRRVLEENVAAMVGRMRPKGAWPRPRVVFCDVAGKAANGQTGWSDIGVLREAGLDARGNALKVDEGVERIRELLEGGEGRAGMAEGGMAEGESAGGLEAGLEGGAGVPRLVVHPRCAGVAAALEGYRYVAAGRPEINKDGTHDHPMDALRYAVCGLGRMGTAVIGRRGY